MVRRLYKQGYTLSNKPDLYPNIDDIVPHSRSGYNFASLSIFTPENAIDIGNLLNVDWNVINLNEFCLGLNIELEHGSWNQLTNITNDDPIMTGKIALIHLLEIPYYYSKLMEIELP